MLRHVRAQIVISLLVIVCFAVGAEARKILVAVPGMSTNLAFSVAKAKGYYQEEGLEVTFVVMRASVSILALIGGDVQFTRVAGATITSVLRGAPLRTLFATFYRPLNWLYGRADIRGVRGLKGKKVGVGTIGDPTDFALRVALRKRGLEGGRDVPIVSIGINPTRYAALISGAVDATVLFIPWNYRAQKAGFRELISFAKEDLTQLTGGISLHEKLLQSDPGLVEKFTRATLKGLLYARAHRDETVPILGRDVGLKKADAGQMYDLIRPAMTSDGTVSKQLLEEALEPFLKVMGIKGPPPVDKIYDFSLVKKIHADLKAQGW